MKKVYVIVEGTGEYSERSESPVLVCKDVEVAKHYMNSLENIVAGVWGKADRMYVRYDDPRREEAKRQYAACLGEEIAAGLSGKEDWQLSEAWLVTP